MVNISFQILLCRIPSCEETLVEKDRIKVCMPSWKPSLTLLERCERFLKNERNGPHEVKFLSSGGTVDGRHNMFQVTQAMMVIKTSNIKSKAEFSLTLNLH